MSNAFFYDYWTLVFFIYQRDLLDFANNFLLAIGEKNLTGLKFIRLQLLIDTSIV